MFLPQFINLQILRRHDCYDDIDASRSHIILQLKRLANSHKSITATMKTCILIAMMCPLTVLAAVALPSTLKPAVDRHLQPARMNTYEALMVRGGATVEESGVAVTKIRNMIRSLLEIGERKSPAVASFLRSLIGTLESVLGIDLLPEVKAEKSRKKKKKKAVDDEEASPADAAPKKKQRAKLAKSKTSEATQKHMTSKISAANPNYRVQRELKEFIKSPPPNLSVKVGSNIRIWIISMKGAENTIYEGEVYKLRVQFPKDYPIVPPSVYFLSPPPLHEHVYTNGDICLSLLGKDWRPTMTAQSIAVSILSILSSAQLKSLPMDNARHSQNKPGQYQKDWVYHDDNC
jgi:ubiquitin-conjugating enzyme E2 W